MLSLPLCVILFVSLAEARVTFTYSEVLQESDLAPNNRAPFKCDNGCNVYTDSRADNIYITEYNAATNAYNSLVNFANIGGTVPMLPEPYPLKASKNYFIVKQGDQNPKFVFYAVDSKAPTINTPVMVIGDEHGIDGNGKGRLFTILSSEYDAHRYNQFVGGFQPGYPRIYSTGFDAVAENACKPLYQARDEESASLAAITVFSPISTVDYGYEGEHNVNVKWSKDGSITKNFMSSTVYSSPGYVGCSYTDGQSYFSSRDFVSDGFQLKASSLDVSAVYYSLAADEVVQFAVDECLLNFDGTGSFTWPYPHAFDFAVAIQWKRSTPASSWAVQIDLGTLAQSVGNSACPASKTTVIPKASPTTQMTTTADPSTTSSGALRMILVSIVVAILAIL